MAEPVLAVLLRDGPHDGADTTRYALKCNDVAISISKTPIQIPIPQQSPEPKRQRDNNSTRFATT